MPAVRSAGAADEETVTAVLAEAFLHGDLAPWLIPLIQHRERIYPRYFALLMEHAFAHGQVEVTDDLAGVAVWYTYDGLTIPPPIRDYSARLASITAPYGRRFVALDEAMNDHHPNRRHQYLAFLAVHPDQQGRGYGSFLLRHRHDRTDPDDMPSYLEATGTRNSQLYAAHGYRAKPTFTIGGGPQRLIPMWRDVPSPPPAEPDGSAPSQNDASHDASAPGPGDSRPS